MVLKNKDGTAYRLSSPNPLGASQDHDFLKDGDIILHNFSWKGTDGGELDMVTPVATDMKIGDNVLVIESPKPVQEKEPQEEEPQKPEPVNTIPVEVPKSTKPDAFKLTVSMFCLPAKLKQVRDDFYGDEYYRRTFGKKFSFESVMVEASDLSIRFWTTIPFLTKGSIVFPYRYSDGQKYGEFRWWEIQSIEEKSGGHLVDAIISTVQPDFGDS